MSNEGIRSNLILTSYEIELISGGECNCYCFEGHWNQFLTVMGQPWTGGMVYDSIAKKIGPASTLTECSNICRRTGKMDRCDAMRVRPDSA